MTLRLLSVVSLFLLLTISACKERNTTSPERTVEASQDARPTKSNDTNLAADAFDHERWDSVLRSFVSDSGLVDYAGILKSQAFQQYIDKLSKTEAAGLRNDNERLAFWINAYNALTIRAVLDTLPQDRAGWSEYSIKDQKVNGKTIWKGMKFNVGGGRWTLDEIEHEILRKQDGLRDPRIHVALVCAARGCPPLWNRAFTGSDIDEQLASAMRRFVNDKNQCQIDQNAATIRISQIFNWYRDDFLSPKFTPRARSIPEFLAMSVDDRALKQALKSQNWQLKYLEYDWKLNLK